MEPIQNGLDSLGTYYLIQPECWVRVILYWLIYGPRMNLRSFIILLWHPQLGFVVRIVY